MSDLKDNNKKVEPASGSTIHSSIDINGWRDYYLIMREHWFMGAMAALLISAFVGYFLVNRPAVYETEATLLVEHQGEHIVDIEQVVDTKLDTGGQSWRLSVENHITHMTSRRFRDQIVESFTEEEQDQLLAAYRPKDGGYPTVSVSGLVGRVAVENLGESLRLTLRARHRDADMAALIANRYVSEYLDFTRDRTQAGNHGAIQFLTEQEDELRRSLEAIEDELQEYRRKHNLVSVEDNQGVISQRLEEVSGNLTSTQMERMALESRVRQVEEFQKEGRSLLELEAVSSIPSSTRLVNELDQLHQEREVMSGEYGARHPQMINNQRGIESVESLIQQNIDRALFEMNSQLNHLLDKEEDLLAELAEAEDESLELDRLKMEHTRLQRMAEGARKNYALITDRLNETRITSQLENSNIRVVDFATATSNPVEPNLKRIGMLVVFLGGFVLFGTPFGLAALNTKLKAASEVETLLHQKLLGEIPVVRRAKKADRPHVVERDLDDNVVEAIRGVFSQLQIVSGAGYPKTFLVSSTMPGEGKSFVVNNLGVCFASHKKRTLLIDFDLRRPSLHRFYGRLNNAGIMNWLAKSDGATEVDWDDRALGIAEVSPNLFLLSSGGQTKKASETIGDARVGTLIAALKQQFDVLLVDSPPLGIFPDALGLAPLADQSIYVVRFGRIEREQVRNTLRRMKDTKTEVAGVVMNGMPTEARLAHYYSGYGFANYKYSRYYSKPRF